MLRFDHLAISAERLEEGVGWVEEALGVKLSGGGKHQAMSTHNRLLGLGDLYLEVIAVDPDAPPPGRARWFGLDGFRGAPRITNWVAESDDLLADMGRAPKGIGEVMALARGDYRWRMAVPADGLLPRDGCFPALIQWDGPHPAQALPDAGIRLKRFVIGTPQDFALPVKDDRVELVSSPVKTMTAIFSTPHGERSLG